MAVSMSDISKLRKLTGAGMMDCKKALEETNCDMDAAVEIIRKKGQAVAAKRERLQITRQRAQRTKVLSLLPSRFSKRLWLLRQSRLMRLRLWLSTVFLFPSSSWRK